MNFVLIPNSRCCRGLIVVEGNPLMVKSARELNSYSLHHKGGVVLRLLEEGLNYQTSDPRGGHGFDHI